MRRRWALPVEFPVPGGTTNTYLVGDPPVLVDPVAGLDALELDPGALAHIAVTHTHPDHTAGLARLQTETEATIWALESHRDRFERETGISPDRTFRDGEAIGDSGVHAHSFPGHAPDHVVFRSDRLALVGDLARADGSVMINGTDGDMRAYLTSLRRLRQWDLDTLCPGHGPPIEDPATRLEELIAHRLDRERRVESAVTAGTRTPEAIVETAYDKDLTGLESAAARTVVAHLEKLAVESKVTWDGTTATPP